MNTDRYTKAVLTVIALCLIWMSLGGPSMIPVADAQMPVKPTDVVIVGWRDSRSETWRFPATQPPPPPLNSFDRERLQRERENRGARLPVDPE